jgi:DNA-directed RNA polymerase-3 subunit RPC5
MPVDTRPEVWNQERASSLGTAQVEDDRLKNQEMSKGKQRKEEPRLSEVRMQSEMVQHKGVYMIGVVRDGEFALFRYALD